MQAQKTQHNLVMNNLPQRLIAVALILLFLFVIGLYVNNVIKAYLPPAGPSGQTTISQADFEEKYGLRVNLVALTAAGGMVDVRLKIVDGEKLKLLLSDKTNFPTLISEQGVVLNAPVETKSQEIQFINGGNLFIIYPNSGNAIKPNETVTILFGTTAVEPIKVK